MMLKPAQTMTATTTATRRSSGAALGFATPRVRAELHTPWKRWSPSAAIATR